MLDTIPMSSHGENLYLINTLTKKKKLKLCASIVLRYNISRLRISLFLLENEKSTYLYKDIEQLYKHLMDKLCPC